MLSDRFFELFGVRDIEFDVGIRGDFELKIGTKYFKICINI